MASYSIKGLGHKAQAELARQSGCYVPGQYRYYHDCHGNLTGSGFFSGRSKKGLKKSSRHVTRGRGLGYEELERVELTGSGFFSGRSKKGLKKSSRHVTRGRGIMSRGKVEMPYIAPDGTNYAQFAKEAYARPRLVEIGSYIQLPEYTTDTLVTYYSHAKREIVLAVRGTVITSAVDLASDLNVVRGTTKLSVRYLQANRMLKRILKDAAGLGASMVIVGHSLGGRIAQTLLREHLKDVDRVYTYASGASPINFLNSLIPTRRKAIIRKKERNERVSYDPISVFGEHVHNIKGVKGLNPHTIDNWVTG